MNFVAVIYVHEVVDPEIRGGLGSVGMLMVVFVYFLATLMGALLPWYTTTQIGYIFPGWLRPEN